MNKSLFLMRHAEADSPAGGRDFDRPLTARGAAMARDVGARLAGQGLAPELILASPSLRTRTTAEMLAAMLPQPPRLELLPALYGAMPESVIETIRSADESCARLMIIGHNPWVHMLAITMPQPGELARYAELRVMYPPSSCVRLGFEGYWGEVDKGRGKIQDYFYSMGNS